VDNDSVSDSEKKKDAFWQLKPFIKALQKSFLMYYVCELAISLDEMTTPFKGRNRAKQFNPNKPDKWGYKDFAICEAETGYCAFFYPYQGKDQRKPHGMSLGEFALRSVLKECFWYGGYILAMDNWFTTWAGILFCLSVGVHVVATLWAGRVGFPKSDVLDIAASAARGTFKVMQHTGHSVYVCCWKDNKIVRMVTTFQFGVGTCRRRIKEMGIARN
jgi:hypothetical protein